MEQKSIFSVLNAVNVNGHTETKNGLTYLSWAWAWSEVKKAFPDSTYTIYESAQGWNYHTDGHTAWVKTGVTINGLEHIEYLPVMDFRNASIPLEKVTSFDVNKAIQRSLTKACARHGLGLYIYAGEDLPESATSEPTPAPKKTTRAKATAAKAEPAPAASEPDKGEEANIIERIKAAKSIDEIKGIYSNVPATYRKAGCPVYNAAIAASQQLHNNHVN